VADKAAIRRFGDEEAFRRIVDLHAKKSRRVPFRRDLRYLPAAEFGVVGCVPYLAQEP
jgi:hypothetical protein